MLQRFGISPNYPRLPVHADPRAFRKESPNMKKGPLTVGTIKTRFPTAFEVIGSSWIGSSQERLNFISEHATFFEQLDHDLSILENRLEFRKLLQCYRSALRILDFSKVWDTIYEIHGSALLSIPATTLNLHVPLENGTNRNFDIQAVIQETVINADSKTRLDDSLFRDVNRWTEDGIDMGFFSERATIDPHDLADMGIKVNQATPGANYDPIPESTIIRQKLRAGLVQLPTSGCNVIIFGHKVGDRDHLERALYGSELPMVLRDRTTKHWHMEWTRTPTGAFRADEKGEPFRSLSGVLWVRLMIDPFDDVKLYRSYKWYPNPYAATKLPLSAVEAIEAVCNAWTIEPSN